MKLTVVVPSEDYKSFAGARIRYDRIAASLGDRGIALSIEEIGRFNPDRTASDAVLISKCHDARSLMVAALFRDRGKLVGVDLFDDYFSQSEDSRLVRYRHWLADLVPICDFALCSTKRMADVVALYRGDLPVLVMNDSAPLQGDAETSTRIFEKLRKARETRTVRLAWFGVGDNTYFPIGLRDLATCAPVLNEFRRSGFDIDLTVLTNARALGADGLTLINRLPVPTRVEEWSEAVERAVLTDAFAVLLPVNAQRFSVAKSLNRAVTALSFGCQILSTGFPLYDPFDEFIYRDAATLLSDFAEGTMRLSAEAFDDARTVLKQLASPEVEAEALAEFLKCQTPPAPRQALPPVLIHGHSTRAEAHRTVQALGGLSVASPFCAAPLDFDVLFRGDAAGLRMFVSRRASARLLPASRRRVKGHITVRGEDYLELAQSKGGVRRTSAMDNRDGLRIAVQLALYGKWMSELEERMAAAFGPSRIFHSETSPLFPDLWRAA